MGERRAASNGFAAQACATARQCQEQLGQLLSLALSASAQLQISACRNAHEFAEAVAHPTLRSRKHRRRRRPSMMCCLSSASGGASATSNSGNSVRIPRTTDVSSLHIGRDGGTGDAANADSTSGGPEEPILISEVGKAESGASPETTRRLLRFDLPHICWPMSGDTHVLGLCFHIGRSEGGGGGAEEDCRVKA